MEWQVRGNNTESVLSTRQHIHIGKGQPLQENFDFLSAG